MVEGGNRMEDSWIVELYWQRKEEAIEQSDIKYGPYCFTVANNILYNSEDSEECVQDTWIHAWNSIPPQRPQNLKAFLVKITRNLSLDRYRKKNAEKRGGGQMDAVLEELEECTAGTRSVEGEFQAKELERSIKEFVRNLSERDCSIFLRRYFYAESTEAIAEKYDLKESNVLMILSRVRKKLKVHLEMEGYRI